VTVMTFFEGTLVLKATLVALFIPGFAAQDNGIIAGGDGADTIRLSLSYIHAVEGNAGIDKIDVFVSCLDRSVDCGSASDKVSMSGSTALFTSSPEYFNGYFENCEEVKTSLLAGDPALSPCSLVFF